LTALTRAKPQQFKRPKKEEKEMKRRKLFISLALVLMLTALMPATAAAGNDRHVPTESFTGSGLIYVTYMPDPIIKGNVWRYQGEIVEGFLAQCDWELLAGTVFYSDHDSTVRVDDEGNASGVMKGDFSLTRPDGTGILEGSFTGSIQGNLFTGDIRDNGTWQSTKGTGVFEDVKASGKWSAELCLGAVPGTDIITLIGPVTWEGKYISPTQPPGVNKPGKPDKPGRPIEPGKPVKPWQPIKPGKP
jgi:hypothetical protein